MKTRSLAALGTALAFIGVTGVFIRELTSDSTTSNTAQAAEDYINTFDTAASLDGLDFYVANGRDAGSEPPTSWPGDHAAGAPCGGPLTNRTVNWPDRPVGPDGVQRSTSAGEAAYWCAPGGVATGHLMTAFLTHGYAHLDFSPKERFVDVRKVCWDQNVTNLGNRKWTQVTIAPTTMTDPVAPRLDFTYPGFRIGGPASWGLGLEYDAFMFASTQGNAEAFTGDSRIHGSGYENDQTVSDKAKRVTTCLTDLRNGEIEVSQQRVDDSVTVTVLPGEFPVGESRVIFQDVSYNPDKAESPPTVSNPYTWHWDNLFVSTSPNSRPPSGGGTETPPPSPTTPPPPTVAPSIAGEFDSLPPARLADTRPEGSTVDGRFVRSGAVQSNAVLELQIGGRGGVGADAAAAALNVTSVGASGPGFLTLYQCGQQPPNSSHVNYLGGDVVANLVVVPLDSDGKVCVFAKTATHVVVDTVGSFPVTTNYAAQTPSRYLDTRAGEQTFDGTSAGVGRRTARTVLSAPVAGRGGVPAGAKAVVVNIGVVNPGADGFVTAYPCGEDRPVASNLNFVAGQTVSNAAVVRVGTGGEICLYTLAATDLIVDVQGSFTDDDAFGSFSPFRLFDSRPGQSTGDGRQAGTGRAAAGSITEIDIGGRAGIPATAGAVSLSVIVVNPSGPGYATVFPCGQGTPTASNLNYQPGDITTNAVFARIGAGDKVCLYTLTDADVVVDVNGWFPE